MNFYIYKRNILIRNGTSQRITFSVPLITKYPPGSRGHSPEIQQENNNKPKIEK